MKQLFTYPLLIAVSLLLSCSNNGEEKGQETDSLPSISGTIVKINDYGQLIPDFTPADMGQVGFDYADLVDVEIGDDIHLFSIPYLTSFNEVGVLDLLYVDYNARGDDYGFGLLNGDFHRYVGGEVGDKVTIRLAEKEGYRDTYELMKSVYPTERRSNETAEQYANFRMVTTSGIASGVLYRSSNPLNCEKNPGRYAVVDSLARTVGIRTEIDLADTRENVEKYMASEGYASSYCPQLYREGQTMLCGMNADTFCDAFKQKMGEAARFMLDHQPPYLIHCNEGKDRCGFVSMLFEALAGASLEELQRDYMVTMLNFYQIEDEGDSYKVRQVRSINRMIWLLCHEEALDDYKNIIWESIDIDSVSTMLQEAARNYFKECGLSDSECAALQSLLQHGK